MANDTVIRIAIADDHEAIRIGYADAIDTFDGMHITISAENGADLLQQIEAAKQKPHICLLDLNMPVMNGFDTITALRKKWPEIKVIALTMHREEPYIIRMVRDGASGYLLKNLRPYDLKEALKIVYNDGFCYTDTVTKELVRDIKNHKKMLPDITKADLQLLQLVYSGMSNKEIGTAIQKTEKAVEKMNEHLCDKLQVRGRVGLAVYAVRYGMMLGIEMDGYAA